ncbi:molybdenum ABC transporter ATP-binding protein [Nitratireductor pacificus]|uniref:Molybdenum ABC transporter ATP-binding protein n=1 Tax=Nitratireductor pacificus pht-3B TaxID=391937 RepID=K2MIM9_9HYPH|nr:molybdenum ABC transporter ATP-binding protein [Nitratireductor pacificus]EKF17017.1 molybdenum ABC transporter ATP-binding protein [Nitratireductor pacificus pht-3B]
MSALEVDIRGRAGSFEIETAFSAGPGVTALFGPSGAGKSTLLKMIAGTARPRSGRIVVAGSTLYDSAAGIDLPPERRGVGFVFQEARLFPHLSVRRNLTYARWAGRRRGTRAFDEVVALLGIGDRLDSAPATLSGGERQRVAIGRALLADPALLLMDEPLSSLDKARRGEILPYLEAIRTEAGIPILYVSHETAEVAQLADTVVLVDKGRVAGVGPAAAMLARFSLAAGSDASEAATLIEGRVTGIDPAYHTAVVSLETGRLELTGNGFAEGMVVRLRVRAADVAIASAPHDGLSIRNQLPCTVGALHRDGAFAMVTLHLGEQRLIARITAKSADMLDLAPGREAYALLKAVSVEMARIERQTTGG